MGDIIHTLPALTDAGKAIPGIVFDWAVEDSFTDIPRWHPLVDRVIPVALRRWRKGIFSRDTRIGWKRLREQLHAHQYDYILDAQGLVKSAFLAFFAKGKRVGLDWASAREPLASLAYQHKCSVNFYQHAIVRMRSLFSLALGYTLPAGQPDFGLDHQSLSRQGASEKYIVFLHGTTWMTKQWPESYWIQLAKLAGQSGYRIKISGNNAEEMEKATRIGNQNPFVDVLPRLDIQGMAALLANAQAAVAVDTGLGHLAAALDIPTVSIYGPTNPEYTGALGKSSIHLAANFSCSPCLSRECKFREAATVSPACYSTIPPAPVWDAVQKLLLTR
jgi:heptosyltransferase-1